MPDRRLTRAEAERAAKIAAYKDRKERQERKQKVRAAGLGATQPTNHAPAGADAPQEPTHKEP